ncbi:NUDIX hydrolase [Aeromicrobium terrae]|uniref:NUDIX hydrolase n=1 Tax=Aeromicrobium terrae TaxID=2498846 RepID=A0A5C8NIB1_9ACTN|nr:NUDIX domain-containing protein [Aeromicrobium terrae]TXL60645.1 NUDIX hydrolase [Aeromicrobium terrae]
MRIPVPDSLREHAAKVAGNPATPRPAATIVLVRDGADGIEAYLMRRQSTMAFAPGVYVFPGGKVQESDAAPVDWVGPSAEEWGERFGCDPETARALVVAAVRETFEESGILLAGPDADTVVGDTSSSEMQAARVALENGEYGFAQFLAERSLVLRADLLGAWSHWITPEFEPRRYDTRFFVAALPAGQVVGELPGESDKAAWMPLTTALAAMKAGEAAMLPPTAITCKEVSGLTAQGILEAAAARSIIPIEPKLVEVDGQLYLENPLEDP